jgi:tetratricopeptide (TPR) repeat protein
LIESGGGNISAAFYNRGLAHLSVGQPGKAIDDFSAAIDRDSDNVGALTMRGQTYFEQGDSEAALADYNRALEIDRNYLYALVSRAVLHKQAGRLDLAMADIERAVAKHPDQADVWLLRGSIRLAMGDPAKALPDIERAIDLKSDDHASLAERADALIELKRFSEAAADLEKAIALAPDNGELYSRRGLLRMKTNADDQARADFDRAIKLAPESQSGWNNRGLLNAKLERYKQAVADYDRAIQLEPNWPAAYVNRANAKTNLGRHREAIADFQRALALNPKMFQAELGLAYAYFDQGQNDSTISHLDRAEELNPRNAGTFAFRGYVLWQTGQAEKARGDFKRALELDPGMTWVTQALREAEAQQSARATQNPNAKGRIIMVIGNSAYPHIGNLKNAANDARAVAAAFKARGYTVVGPGGSAEPHLDLTRAQFEEALTRFQKESESAAIALIWYAGHGSSFRVSDIQKNNFLLPVDFRSADARDILNKGVSVDRLKRAAMPASLLRMLIVDACRDNSVESATRGTTRGMTVEGKNKDFIILFSTQAGAPAEDGDGDLSPFAKGFLAEFNANPKAPLSTFLTGVSARVKVETAARQVPEVFSQLTDTTLALTK